MKKRRFDTPLSAATVVAAMLVLLVGLNVVGSRLQWRADLTEERAFTLSEGARRILANLKSPVQVRFYYSQSDEAMPMVLKNYAQSVNDLLDAMAAASGGRFQVQRLDPAPDTDAEDSARLDGVDPQVFPDGDRIYLGLGFSQLDRKSALPFLAPDRERLLEYDIARAINAVTKARKPLVGLLTPLATGPQPPMMMVEGPPSAGVFFEELRRALEVREIPFDTTAIPPDIGALLVVHPRQISEATEYAIDQFVLRGGKLVAFLDPMCAMDTPPGGPMAGMAPPSVSTLGKLLPAWGVRFDTSEIVVDMQNVGNTRRGRAPGILALGPDALDTDSVVTGGVDSLFMALAGAFQGEAPEGLARTVLVFSSRQSELADPSFTQSSPQMVERNFQPSGAEYALAVKLEGTFKTAFPPGQPGAVPDSPETAPGRETSPAPAAAPGRQASSGLTTVYLVGDVDMLFDPLAVAEVPTPFGRPVVVPANGNIDLAQSMIEQLAGGDELASVRSRASRDRPFTVVKRLQAEAEGKFRDKISELEQGLNETQARLVELERGKDAGQQFILTPDQQEEIKAFRRKEAEAKKELKEVRKTLRREVDALEQRVKWTNILAMPLIVAAAGLLIAFFRHRRQGAR
ncbi:MAG: Gldg family protein [Chthoniobacterales bacterium]